MLDEWSLKKDDQSKVSGIITRNFCMPIFKHAKDLSLLGLYFKHADLKIRQDVQEKINALPGVSLKKELQRAISDANLSASAIADAHISPDDIVPSRASTPATPDHSR